MKKSKKKIQSLIKRLLDESGGYDLSDYIIARKTKKLQIKR